MLWSAAVTRRTLIIAISTALAWTMGVFGLVVALERSSPLFVNLGAGDEAFARGFRGGWERDGLRGSGETMFRWTTDGARLEFPVRVVSGRLTARIRLARFAPGDVALRLYVGDRLVEEWVQPSRGWALKTIDLGEPRGRLWLRFRSASEDQEELGAAIDWVEVRGVGWFLPASELLPGLFAFFLGAPLLVLGPYGTRPAYAAHIVLLVLATVAVFLDRLGGLVAVARAGFPCVLVISCLILVWRVVGRLWPEGSQPLALVLPLVAVAIFLLALLHPFFYYPDVDTHARFVTAIRSDPRLALDPRPYQSQTGAWTRGIDGRLVAFPYSPVFHLIALPLAGLLGEVAAIKTVAVAGVGLTLLLAFILSHFALGEARHGVLAQAALVLLPVTSSRLCLALYPALLGQALEVGLLLGLTVLSPRLPDTKAFVALWGLLIVAQASYTGSLANVAAVVFVFGLIEAARGSTRRGACLLLAWALSVVVVVAALYARFVPTLLRDVLPHAASGSHAAALGAPSVLAGAARRLWVFYGPVLPIVSALGLCLVSKGRGLARRALTAAFLAGVTLLLLRFVFPTLFRDVKEVELLAVPVAVGVAGSLAWLWSRGWPERAAGLGLGLAFAVWGAARAASAYGERFLAVGRGLPW